MRTYLFIGRTVLATSLALIPWIPGLSTQAADQPAGNPEIMGAQPSIRYDAPVLKLAPAQATWAWVDDIADALGSYFKANYPQDDFAPYLKKLSLIQDGLGRGDRRTVKLETGAFFTMLTNRGHGISEGAAEELTNFAKMVMTVQEYGIVFPRSGPEQYGTTLPWSEVKTQRGENHGVGNQQETSYVD